VFPIGRRPARARGLQALQSDLVEIAQESVAEILLLPCDEAEQGKSAQGSEGEKQALPKAHGREFSIWLIGAPTLAPCVRAVNGAGAFP
jgi:hypothetical protein